MWPFKKKPLPHRITREEWNAYWEKVNQPKKEVHMDQQYGQIAKAVEEGDQRFLRINCTKAIKYLLSKLENQANLIQRYKDKYGPISPFCKR
jgi:hypothetical protein